MPAGKADVHAVVFIDSRVPDIQDLLNGLQPGEQAFIIDAGSDGLDQIAAILQAHHFTDLSAIQIVAHGASGELTLGSTTIDAADLAGHAGTLATIGAALTADGDIALYACNTAASTVGQQFIANLAAYTGADIAASTHLVGSTEGGGSWTLDASTGAIEAQTPFTATALANFEGELAGQLSGQIWYGVGGDQVGSTTQFGYVNSDGSNQTVAGTSAAPSAGFSYFSDIGLDTAAGLYFAINSDANNDDTSLVVGSMSTGARIGNPILLNPNGNTSDYVVKALAVDTQNHFIYLGIWGALTDSGIIKVPYNPFTGVINNGNDILTGTGAGATVDPSLYVVKAGTNFTNIGNFSLDVAHQKLYFAANDMLNTGAFYGNGYTDTNGVYVVDLATTTTTTAPTLLSSAFVSDGNHAIVAVAVNAAHNIIYFATADYSGNETYSSIYSMSTTPGSPITQMTLPAALANGLGFIFDLAYDPVANQLIVSDGGHNNVPYPSLYTLTLNAAGTAFTAGAAVANADDAVLSAYTTGIAFDALATIGTLTGTTTHALQGGSGITLLAATPTGITDPDSGGVLKNATVTITNAQTGDVLGIGATFSYTTTPIRVNAGGGAFAVSFDSATHTLTIANWTGFENTFDQYEAILALVSYQDGGTSGVTQRTITWQVNDGASGNPVGTTNVAATSVNIDVNHPPTVTPDTNAAVAGGIAVTGNVLLNDSDSDNDTLQVSAFTDGSAGTVGTLFHGTYGDLTLNADGSYTFTAGATAGQQTALTNAAANSHPTEVVTYTASDGHGGATQSTLTITIDRAPVAVADTATAVAGGSNLVDNIVNNDSDKDGDSLQVSSFTVGSTAGILGTAVSGTYGNFTLSLSGSYIYTAGATVGQQTALANAPAGSHPTEVITYTISDLHGGTATSTLTITLDRLPVGVVDTDSANFGDAPATGNVLTNDTDPDNDTLQVSAFTDGGAGTVGTLFHGTYGDITLNADGTYTFTAGATAGQQNALNLAGGHGTEVVTYTMSDGKGGTAQSTLCIDVTTAPFITSVSATTTGGVSDLNTGKIVTITVNFNNPVSVTGAPQLQLSDNLVATIVSGSGSQSLVFSYTVQPGDNSSDLKVLSLLPNGGTIQGIGAQDANLTNAAADLHLQIDTVAPTVTVSADHTSLTLAQGTALVTFAFSEAVQLFTLGDVTVTGGSFGALTHVGINGAGEDIYTATFTPTAGNAVAGSVQVRPSTYIDGAANAGAASNTLAFTGDIVAPTVSVAADHNTLHAGDTALVTFTFSEAVADFTLADVVVSGGTVGTFTHVGVDGSGQDVYTVIFTPSADNAEVGSVQLNAGSYTDVLGNAGVASTPVTFSGDTLAPTVAVTAVPNALQAGQTSTVTFTFSEAVAAFALDAAHVAVAGGTLSNLVHVGAVGTNDVYTAVFTPDVNDTEVGSVQVIAASYADTSGNAGAVSNTVSFSGDTRAPSVTVTPPASPVLAGQPLVVTFTFSETVTGFDITDIIASGGTLTNFSHPGLDPSGQDVYTVEFVPTSPDAVSGTVQINASSYFDTAGNAGTASNTATFTGDIQPPSVTVSADHTALLAGQTALVTFTFSELVAGFALDATHIAVSGGTLSNLTHVGFAAGQDVYTAVFTPDASNTEVGSVQVVAAGYTDVAGNAGTVSNTVNFSGDTLAPSVTVSADHTGLVAGQTALLTFTFSEANPAFALTDVIVSGGTLGNLTHVGGAGGQDVYTATFTPDVSNAEVGSVQVKDHIYTDAAGNQSTASNVVHLNGDTLPPTVAVTADHATLHANDTALVTFSFSEAVTGFALDDVTVSGGGLTNLAPAGIDLTGHILYTATFTPDVTDSLSAHLSVAASSYTDGAGNSGAASNALNFNGDTKAPAAPTLALHQDSGLSSADHITNNPLIDYSWSNLGDTLQYKVDGAPGFTTTAPSFATDGSQDGQHTVSIQETDAAGNVSEASSLTFTLDTTAPHLAAITALPSSGTVTTGSAVQLTLAFDEAVNVNGGTPTLTLNDGSSAVYDAAASDSFKLVFDHLVSSTDHANGLAVTSFAANGAVVSDVAGNAADLSTVSAVFDALNINPAAPPANENTAPAFTIGGITRPELHFDTSGHILMDAAASAFAGQYGIEYLYLGLPPGTPYPPVDLHA